LELGGKKHFYLAFEWINAFFFPVFSDWSVIPEGKKKSKENSRGLSLGLHT